MLSQQIDFKDPFTWLVARRNDVNYNSSKFSEPIVPEYLRPFDRAGLRRSVNAYVSSARLT